jgi:hypothetical protein
LRASATQRRDLLFDFAFDFAFDLPLLLFLSPVIPTGVARQRNAAEGPAV